jgi:hypothetical protein
MGLASKLDHDLRSKKLTFVTKTLGEVAQRFGYRLKPPFTEVVHLEAQAEEDRFVIHFSAKLHLHYSDPQTNEGLVFTITFGGESYADSPDPPLDELFATGMIDSFVVYGYGSRWGGQTSRTPQELADRVEVRSATLNKISLDDFLDMIATI